MSSESEHVNPFAAPLASDAPEASQQIPLVGSTNVEALRREHLNREASIQSIGWLYSLSAVVFTIATISIIGVMVTQPPSPNFPLTAQILAAAIALGLSVVFWHCSFGLRKLRPSIRPWAVVVSSVMTLLSLVNLNPIGLALNGYIWWLVGSGKGKYVLSPDYAEVISATPHIKYKTSIIVWILLAMVLVLIGIGGVVLLMDA